MDYTLPDGEEFIINIRGVLRMQVPELMFKPELDNQRQDMVSLQQCAWNSIMDSDIDLRAEFSKNIVMAGGNTLF